MRSRSRRLSEARRLGAARIRRRDRTVRRGDGNLWRRDRNNRRGDRGARNHGLRCRARRLSEARRLGAAVLGNVDHRRATRRVRLSDRSHRRADRSGRLRSGVRVEDRNHRRRSHDAASAERGRVVVQDGAHRGGVDGRSGQTLRALRGFAVVGVRCRVVHTRCTVVDISHGTLAGRLDRAGRGGSFVRNHCRVDPLRGGRDSISIAVLGRGDLVRLLECDLPGRSLGDKNWGVSLARGRDGIDTCALISRRDDGGLL